jgi:hypothetical protein
MKRIAAVLATWATLLLGTAGVAHADTHSPPMAGGCGGGYGGEALSTELHYRPVTWDAGNGTLGIDAPRGWSFVRTPDGEGRFHDPDGHDLLSLRALSRAGTPEAEMRAQVEALAGTTGLRVIGQHTQVMGRLGQRWATLTYKYSSMGEPRIVKERWIAQGTGSTGRAVMVVTVAGRSLDGSGLEALIAYVSPTANLAD